MGHYRSEMGYDAEDEREWKRKQEMREESAAKIRKAIKKEGIEYVLADICAYDDLAKCKYR